MLQETYDYQMARYIVFQRDWDEMEAASAPIADPPEYVENPISFKK